MWLRGCSSALAAACASLISSKIIAAFAPLCAVASPSFTALTSLWFFDSLISLCGSCHAMNAFSSSFLKNLRLSAVSLFLSSYAYLYVSSSLSLRLKKCHRALILTLTVGFGSHFHR